MATEESFLDGETDQTESATADEEAARKSDTDSEKLDVTQTKEWKGLLADLQNERAEKHELRSQIQTLTEQVNALLARQQEAQEGTAGEEEEDSDMLVSRAEVDKLVEQKLQRLQEQASKQAEAALVQRAAEAEKKARERYSVEQVGEGLDFDTVLAEGRPLLKEGDLLEIRRAADPAEEAYRRCIMASEALQKRQLEAQNRRLADQLRRNTSTRGLGAGAGGLGGLMANQVEEEKLYSTDPSELLKAIEEAERSG